MKTEGMTRSLDMFSQPLCTKGWPRCCIKVDGWCEKLARAYRLARLDPNSKLAPELFLLIIHSLYV